MRMKFTLFSLTVVMFVGSLCVPAQHKMPLARQVKADLEQTSQGFIELYRKRLDFKECFDKYFIRDAVARMRHSGFFKSMNIDQSVIDASSDRELAAAYAAMMKYRFASLVYAYNYPHKPVPAELAGRAGDLRYLRSIINESNEQARVTTKQDLIEFTREFNEGASIDTRSLPPDPFNTNQYKRQTAMVNADMGVGQLDGLPNFDVPAGRPVFVLSRDLFNFYFVKEDGKYRVVTLGFE